jgi:hypothetical protein
MNFFVSIDRNKKTDVMCPKGRTQNRNGGKMKKKAVEKVEMKESLLKGEALALNDAELEGAAGGGITVATHLSCPKINQIDCHRMSRYNGISLKKGKVPGHLQFRHR